MTKSELEIVNELWSLWESLAEAGEIQIGVGFFSKHDRLEKQVKNLNEETEAEPLATDLIHCDKCGMVLNCCICT